MPKKIMIIAGEASGDFHGASLIQALKSIDPELEICGMGGEKMRQTQAKIYFDIDQLAIIGFTGVISNIQKIHRLFRQLLQCIDQEKPDVIVLVDYPGFNLRLAKEIKKRRIPVVYYISPQIWAWWGGRIRQIQQYVDKMIVVFGFEEKLYRRHQVPVSFVGHPLLDHARPTATKDQFLSKLNLDPTRPTIGIMPGSRKIEIERILPIFLASAKLIQKQLPQAQFILLKAAALNEEIFTRQLNNSALVLACCKNQTYDFLNAVDFVLVASGTATLEAAIMQTPMIIVYKVSFLNWLIAKSLIKLPFIGLVNVVAGKKIVPEFIQYQAQPAAICAGALALLNNPAALTKIKGQLAQVKQNLGTPGASLRAAEAILAALS